MRKSENGSALVYILIAIALMAALAYNITRGSRSGSGMLTEEQNSLLASEIIAYSDVIAQTVQKLKLRGCKDTEISFENLDPQWPGTYTNPNAPSDKSCHVFEVGSGNTNTYTVLENFLASPYGFTYSGMEAIGEVSVEDVGTSESELTLWIYYLKRDICIKIHEKIGLPSPQLENVGVFTGVFTGTYGSLAENVGDDSPTDILKGKLSGCVMSATLDYGHYYQVLIAR